MTKEAPQLRGPRGVVPDVTGILRRRDRLQIASRKTSAPTTQWSQLARPSPAKPSTLGATKVHAPRITFHHSCQTSILPMADSATRTMIAPNTHAFHAAWLTAIVGRLAMPVGATCVEAPNCSIHG